MWIWEILKIVFWWFFRTYGPASSDLCVLGVVGTQQTAKRKCLYAFLNFHNLFISRYLGFPWFYLAFACFVHKLSDIRFMCGRQFFSLYQEPTLTKFGVDRVVGKIVLSEKKYIPAMKTLTVVYLVCNWSETIWFP